ncbi:MAG: glycosyltransferase family 2 protein [Acidobacteriota bacterium]
MISILVPSWRAGDRLLRLVASVERVEETVEVAICDNGGDVEGLPDEVRVIRPGRNLGFAGGCNALAREARGEILLFLNPDCEVLGDTVARLEAFWSKNPGAGIVGLHLIDAAGATQERYAPRALPTLPSLLGEALLSRLARRRVMPAGLSGPVGQVAGAALSVRPEVLARIGGFDETLWPAWFEDVDLCRRARDAGLAVLQCGDAKVRHEGGYTRKSLGYEGLVPIYYRNMVRYARKHHGAAGSACLRAAIALGMELRAGAAMISPGLAGATRAEAFHAYAAVFTEVILGNRRHHDRLLQ